MSSIRLLIPLYILLSMCYSATVQGIIRDKRTKEPLIGANVMLKGTSLGSSTDENGFYLIQDVGLGKYSLIVSYIGYEDFEEEISVKSKSSIELDFLLIPQALKHQTTTVTANTRKDKITLVINYWPHRPAV